VSATGVVLHTDLSRAELSSAAKEAMVAAAGYVAMEFDLATSSRAARGRGAVAALLAAMPFAVALKGDIATVARLEGGRCLDDVWRTPPEEDVELLRASLGCT